MPGLEIALGKTLSNELRLRQITSALASVLLGAGEAFEVLGGVFEDLATRICSVRRCHRCNLGRRLRAYGRDREGEH